MSITYTPEKRSGPPIMPQGIQKENNTSWDTNQGLCLPTVDNDGSYIRLPTLSGSLNRFTAAQVLDWSVDLADINFVCDQWNTGFFWYDTVDNALWAIAINIGTSPYTNYLAKINPATGDVTNVGSGQPGDNIHNAKYCHRTAHGAGNFFIRNGNYAAEISSIDGSVVTPQYAVTQNGAPVLSAADYQTADEEIYIQSGFKFDTTVGTFPLVLQRNGETRYIYLHDNPLIYNSNGYIINWLNYIAVYVSGSYTIGPRYFNRADFDQWLHDICDYYGLSKA